MRGLGTGMLEPQAAGMGHALSDVHLPSISFPILRAHEFGNALKCSTVTPQGKEKIIIINKKEGIKGLKRQKLKFPHDLVTGAPPQLPEGAQDWRGAPSGRAHCRPCSKGLAPTDWKPRPLSTGTHLPFTYTKHIS